MRREHRREPAAVRAEERGDPAQVRAAHGRVGRAAPASRGRGTGVACRHGRARRYARVVRRVCVFCGASSGRSPAYAEAARAFGAAAAARGLGIVYGGGKVGLMGAVADGALAAGGEVIGVIPQELVERELAHGGLTELHVVGSLHERKALMAELADGVRRAPGRVRDARRADGAADVVAARPAREAGRAARRRGVLAAADRVRAPRDRGGVRARGGSRRDRRRRATPRRCSTASSAWRARSARAPSGRARRSPRS